MDKCPNTYVCMCVCLRVIENIFSEITFLVSLRSVTKISFGLSALFPVNSREAIFTSEKFALENG